MKPRFSYLGASLGWAVLVFLHFYRIGSIPGLHYDEAWAFNFSWRIASAPGFWPLTAMSPYTAPWAHYWAALWLRLLGPSVAVFRSSQVSLALVGLAFLSFALPKHVRAAFPWVCLVLPGLVLNHRFAIELTGFHVLCFGVLCWALRRERWLLACLATFFGSTAHILFYGVALGLLGTVCLEGIVVPRRARSGALIYFSLMGLFLLRVLAEIPEKGKAAALALSALGALGILAGHGEKWAIWRSGWWKGLAFLGASVFVLNALFYLQGTWTATLYTGTDLWSDLRARELFELLVGGCALSVALLSSLALAKPTIRTAIGLLALTTGAMMLKPAPRYYEVVFLGFLSVCTLLAGKHTLLGWGRFLDRRIGMNWKGRILAGLILVPLYLSLFLSFSALTLPELAYLRGPTNASLHFLFFKDSSRDFLDKQDLARFLGGSGCARSAIQTHDPRLKEELDALSLGDWPVAEGTKCRYDYAALRDEAGATGTPFGEFLVRRTPE